MAELFSISDQSFTSGSLSIKSSLSSASFDTSLNVETIRTSEDMVEENLISKQGKAILDIILSRKRNEERVPGTNHLCVNPSPSPSPPFHSSKPHKEANDLKWATIHAIQAKEGPLGMDHFTLLSRLGCGDIGSVYLAELRVNPNPNPNPNDNPNKNLITYPTAYPNSNPNTNANPNPDPSPCLFAIKMMDKRSLASRKKMLRAKTEREILECLDHPFLPSLYTHFETEKLSCLVMEFCPGGDLHILRQRQPGKHFLESAVRFYAAEVLLALEYLHMMGVIYRDLKPENILVRQDGHIMLSDFDLSLRCIVRPTLVLKPETTDPTMNMNLSTMETSSQLPICEVSCNIAPQCVAPPSCIAPSCFVPRFFTSILSSKKNNKNKNKNKNKKGIGVVGRGVRNSIETSALPELMAEPIGAHSMSFVGTHEYLAPEIIKGEGHGSAVDWWTYGIFLYELLHGKTPFKGSSNRATLFNVIGQPLKFPETPSNVSTLARDLIAGLLVKEPQHRLAYQRGAVEIKQHPFFEGVNWALIRSMTPPEIPKPFNRSFVAHKPRTLGSPGHASLCANVESKSTEAYLDLEFF